MFNLIESNKETKSTVCRSEKTLTSKQLKIDFVRTYIYMFSFVYNALIFALFQIEN